MREARSVVGPAAVLTAVVWELCPSVFPVEFVGVAHATLEVQLGGLTGHQKYAAQCALKVGPHGGTRVPGAEPGL